MNSTQKLALCLVLLLALQCEEQPTVPVEEVPFPLNLNVGSDHATLTGSANALSYGTSQELMLVKRPYECVITIANYLSGTGELILNDAPGVALFIDSLSANHQTRMQIPPNLKIQSIQLRTENLTADIDFRIEPIGINTATQALFPNHLGDRWVYEWSDSLRFRLDSLVVTVVGLRRMESGPIAKMWAFDYRAYDHVDTVFVYQTGDTAYLSSGIENGRWKYVTIVYPQTVSSPPPHTPNFDYIYFVDQVDTVIVPAGTFTAAYRYSSLPVDDIECTSSYAKWWVQDNVGIVQHFQFICKFNRSELWRLMSYTSPYHFNP